MLRPILLGMKKVSEREKKHFMFNNFFSENGVYEIMWKNI